MEMRTEEKNKIDLRVKLTWTGFAKFALLAFALIIGGYGIVFSNYAVAFDIKGIPPSTYYMEHYLPIVAVFIGLTFFLSLFDFYSLLGWMKETEKTNENKKLEETIKSILVENKITLEEQEFNNIKKRIREEKKSKKTESKLYL